MASINIILEYEYMLSKDTYYEKTKMTQYVFKVYFTFTFLIVKSYIYQALFIKSVHHFSELITYFVANLASLTTCSSAEIFKSISPNTIGGKTSYLFFFFNSLLGYALFPQCHCQRKDLSLLMFS